MTTMTYKVIGMTCDHCARAVTAELAKLSGVVDIEVEVGSGLVHVGSEQVLDDVAVALAIAAAGYDVV